MKIFKHIKSGQLYILQTLSTKDGVRITALPYSHNGPVLIGVEMKEFIPISESRK